MNDKELGKAIAKIVRSAIGGLNHTRIGYSSEHDYLADPYIDDIVALVASRDQQIASCNHNHTTYRSDGYWDCLDCKSRLFPWTLVKNDKLSSKLNSSSPIRDQQIALAARIEEIDKALATHSITTKAWLVTRKRQHEATLKENK